MVSTSQKVNIKFDPVNPAQGSFVEDMSSDLLYSGAFGAGKTLGLCYKGLKLSWDYPGNFGLLCRKTRKSMTHTTIKTFFDLVCPPHLIADYNKNEDLVTLTNGSQIIFGGLDNAQKLGSLNLGWCGIDEGIETVEDDWTMLDGRLRKPNVPHQMFCATNPGPPTHYLYKLFFKEGRGKVYQASTFDNRSLPKDYLERVSKYTGVYYDRYVLGKWVGLEGLVYDTFKEDICVIPRFEIPKHWLIESMHDFGRTHIAALFTAYDPNVEPRNYFHFAEYTPWLDVGEGKSAYDHTQEFKRITNGYTVMARIGGNHAESDSRQLYTAQGWPISEPEYPERKAQIKSVYDLHSHNRIYVFNDLVNYLQEKASFAFKKVDGVIDENVIEHEARFHLMACERYWASGKKAKLPYKSGELLPQLNYLKRGRN